MNRLDDPEYDIWLCEQRCVVQSTSQLLHAMASREVRMELHRRWRAERCNPDGPYTDDIDRALSRAVADELERRIDRR